MGLYNVFLVTVIILVVGSHGLPTTAANDQAKLPTMTAPDIAPSVRSLLSESDGTNKLRGADNTSGQDEERGFFSTAKLKLFLNLRLSPRTKLVNKMLSKK
ncbi:hypothetical protein PC129_g14963 [Phytophthora cactorum]|uniref:RxLR effector protein n=1 Tax=Phytophthora cactorum TaxID=29920 RepID=A0A329RU43_9STRA|nr:hypothetical protein Pcac1_g13319 [Phytophthora cactorum]KAG2811358.1 hypothetical protein PC112_g15645 [Phytophthora cactorum]KAG2812688.1 hypothetical protein PC111_g14715 [Phytophthora cactorum]KAG2859831.1 hypothetical protein PC113_g8573 [Phytophthora cactorum]KAG2912998.1 hypothetical protein PC114_g8704 [Phytophthora cactorum]